MTHEHATLQDALLDLPEDRTLQIQLLHRPAGQFEPFLRLSYLDLDDPDRTAIWLTDYEFDGQPHSWLLASLAIEIERADRR